SLPAGGTPTPLSGGADAIYPVSIAVSPNGQTLYFTGATGADATPAVFSMPATGGAATALTSGGQLRDPSGIAVATDGSVYVLDTRATGDSSATLFRLMGSGAPTAVAGNLRVGFPAGLTVGPNGRDLLVSGARGSDAGGVVLSVSSAGGTTPLDFSTAGIVSPAGLH